MSLRRPLRVPRPPDFIIGGSGDPYLRRWWVIPRNRWFNVYLHHFLRSDDGRALHDHPWWNVSILLRGAYREHLPDGSVKLRQPWRVWAPWRVTFRRPASAHRIELLKQPVRPAIWWQRCILKEMPVWTLFITGRRVREWSFHCPNGWRHWKDFTRPGDPGSIGPGCGS